MAKSPKQRSHHCKFQTPIGMAAVRFDIEVRNSQIKRGEIQDLKSTTRYWCGCGYPGCNLLVNLKRDNNV